MNWKSLKPICGFYQFCVIASGIAAFLFRLMQDTEASRVCFVLFACGIAAYAIAVGFKYLLELS